MKGFKSQVAVIVVVACIFTTAACSDQNNSSDNNGTDTGNDTNLTDSRRNSTDTVNYLTKDSAKQSQDVIDPNPPGNSH